jgi:predicted DNA-binding transcriptional regulator YafY
MLLQTLGRTTAEKLAAELEVSVRTVYRDLTALSTSGVPVYSERGPGGGVGLVEEYRTSLTGLTPDEVRALFMVSVPAPLAQLGVGQELKAAMLKLSASLPDSRRNDEVRARQRIHLDASWWFQADEAVPALQVIQQAVWNDRLVRMKFRTYFNRWVEQNVAPYGLVAKANVWYVVYAWERTLRAVRVSRVMSIEMTSETFTRPSDFDLPAFWKKWCAEFESQAPFVAHVRVSPEIQGSLRYFLDDRFRNLPATNSKPDPDGWVTLDLPFESFETARTRLLGLGRAVEVLAPEPLRRSMVDFAEQVVALYQRGRDGTV